MTEYSAIDHAMMARALRLAERGAFTTQPNPMVGCVIAQGDRVVGEGWHIRAGEPHAEVHALQMARGLAQGATAYVTLEPCAHHGRTPPCANALVQAGITRVVAASRDPYVQVSGEGFRKLMASGVEVDVGLMEPAARELNRGFFSRIERGKPWLRLKLAMSMDGRTALANGESKWITSEQSRADVQRWRARSGAILTSSETVLADDPQMTARVPAGTDVTPPLRVVLDARARVSTQARVFDASAPTLAVNAVDIVPDYGDDIAAFSVPRMNGRLDMVAMLAQLGQREVNELQVEAGAVLSGALLTANLVDELLLYVAPVFLGDRGRPLFAGLDIGSMAERLAMTVLETRQVGPDLRIMLRPERRV